VLAPVDTPRPPELARPAASYVEVHGVPVAPSAPIPTMAVGVERLSRNLTALADRVRAVRDETEPLLDDPALRDAALVLRGDAFDLAAFRMSHATLPMPEDLQEQMSRLEPDARDSVTAAVAERVHELLESRARPLWCLAVRSYAQSDSERARAQLEAYGEAFVASCAE